MPTFGDLVIARPSLRFAGAAFSSLAVLGGGDELAARDSISGVFFCHELGAGDARDFLFGEVGLEDFSGDGVGLDAP